MPNIIRRMSFCSTVIVRTDAQQTDCSTGPLAIMQDRGPGFTPHGGIPRGKHMKFSCRFHEIPCEIVHVIFIPRAQKHMTNPTESSCSFRMSLPTWYENSVEYFTRNPMESTWKISRMFPHGIPWGYKTGTSVVQDRRIIWSVKLRSWTTRRAEWNFLLELRCGRCATCGWTHTHSDWRLGVKFSRSWDPARLAWAPTPNFHAPTRPATALLWPYVHAKIMTDIAGLLLSKWLTLRYFSQPECRIKAWFSVVLVHDHAHCRATLLWLLRGSSLPVNCDDPCPANYRALST